MIDKYKKAILALDELADEAHDKRVSLLADGLFEAYVIFLVDEGLIESENSEELYEYLPNKNLGHRQ